MTRQSLALLRRLSGPVIGIGLLWFALATFFVTGCAATLICATVEAAVWLFGLPARTLSLLTQLRLPRGLK